MTNYPNRVAEVMRAKNKRINGISTRSGLSYSFLRDIIEGKRPLADRTAARLAKAIGVKPEELFSAELPPQTEQVRVEVETSVFEQLAASEVSLLIELCGREEAELREANRNIVADLYADISAKLQRRSEKPAVREKTEVRAEKPKEAPKVTPKPRKPKDSPLDRAAKVRPSRPFTLEELGDVAYLSGTDASTTSESLARYLNRPVADASAARLALAWLANATRRYKWPEERTRARLAEWLPKSSFAHWVA